MKNKINLDTLYPQEFDNIYRELETSTIKKLNEKSNSTLFYKLEKVLEEVQERLHLITMVRKSGTEWDADEFTRYLLETHFDNNTTEFLEDPITSYMEKYLEVLKDQFKNTKPFIPQNRKLDGEQIVKLIARHKATGLFLKRLGSIRREDSIEIYLKKISREGYTPPKVAEKSKSANLSIEYTENRQILAIYYILDNLKINKNSKVNIARFIHLLAAEDIPKNEDGKEILDNSRIYQKVKSLWGKNEDRKSGKELLFLKPIFENLLKSDSNGIKDILNAIDKDLAKSSIKKNG